jgi:hypothetical protein
MKMLVVTRADDRVAEMSALTHPVFQRFADSWGADFEVLQEDVADIGSYGRWHYRLNDLYGQFPGYDRICHLDTDMIIMPSCPNLFDEVPVDCIGTVLEDVGSRRAARHNVIRQIQQQYGEIGWRTGWINTGVFVTSRMHNPIFSPFNGQMWEENDDPHYGYQIHRLGFKIHEFPYTFNHMSMYSEPWNGSPSRFDSYIMHYAGCARFDNHVGSNSCEDKLKLLRKDYELVYG